MGSVQDVFRPDRVLLATDGSPDAERAARAAADLSRRTGAELHVVHAWTHHVQAFGYPTLAWTDYSYLFEREARKVLAAQVDGIEAAGVAVAEPHLLQGPPVDAVLDLCEELQPGLLVMGSRGLGPVGRLVLGSVTEGVAHHARVPVLVVRGEAWPPGRVVVGDDGSEAARRAAEVGLGVGRLFGAKGLVVRAYRNPPQPIGGWSAEDRLRLDGIRAEVEAGLGKRASSLAEAVGVRPEIRAADGDATLALLVAAEDGDGRRTMICVGSRGLGVVGRIRLGSVSTNVLRAAAGPILVCPTPREAAPRAGLAPGFAARPVGASPG